MTANGMHVCVVGGVFDQSFEERSKRLFTPETVLAEGLRASGCTVTTVGHRGFAPSDRYDIVHVHHLGRAALQMAVSRSRSRYVYSGHDGMLLNGYHVSRQKAAATRFVCGQADAIVTLSDAEQGLLRRRYGKHAGKMRTIRNGFPNSVFFVDPTALERRTAGFRILFVGQLIPLKGVDVLLRAFAQLAGAIDAELLLVYQNPELEADYQALASRLGVAERVRFLGIKSAYEVADLYRSADLFVLPSFAEALPSVIIEAMMCGVPVVATTVGGVAEIVGPYGQLVRPGDVEGLAHAMERSLAENADRSAQAVAIGAYAARAFSVEAMANDHLRLYREIAQAGGAPVRQRGVRRPTNAALTVLLGAIDKPLTGRGLLSH